MWPFSKRGCRAGTPSPQPSDLPPLGDFEQSDAGLKIWLPQVLVDRINWLSVKLNVSRPDIVRGLIFEHVYGRVAYVALIALQEQGHRSTQPAFKTSNAARIRTDSIDQRLHRPLTDFTVDDQPMENLGDGWIRKSRERQTEVDLQYLGKSDEDLTLMLPSRMKADLIAIAEKHNLDPSSYVRKLLVLELLGEKLHRDWQLAVGKVTQEVKNLERE